DAVWLAGTAIGLGLTLAAAFLSPGRGLVWAYLAVTLRLALYALAAGRPGGGYFDQMLRLRLLAGVFGIFADSGAGRGRVSGGGGSRGCRCTGRGRASSGSTATSRCGSTDCSGAPARGRGWPPSPAASPPACPSASTSTSRSGPAGGSTSRAA